MAVPKKKTSKTKTRQRFSNWRSKVKMSLNNAITKAKMLLSERSNYKYRSDDAKDVFSDDDGL